MTTIAANDPNLGTNSAWRGVRNAERHAIRHGVAYVIMDSSLMEDTIIIFRKDTSLLDGADIEYVRKSEVRWI